MELLYKNFLLENITNNFINLKKDFVGISILNSEMSLIMYSLFFTIAIFISFYLVGYKLKRLLYKNKIGKLDFFISIALGYIFIGTSTALIGSFSLLMPLSVYLVLIISCCFGIFPLNELKEGIADAHEVWQTYITKFRQNTMLHIAILSFMLIGFLRLLPPETGVDALWYHTDYPRLYVKQHSMMGVDPFGKYYPIVTPTLNQMTYLIAELFSLKDASRYIHFTFYLLVIALLIVNLDSKQYPYTKYVPLLLGTSPTVIRHASSAYGESQWLLCWILAILLLTQTKNEIRKIGLAGIVYGGALATKLWMLCFYPVFLLYIFLLYRKRAISFLMKVISLFLLLSLLVPLVWYIRAYIVTGNPVFPSFSPYPLGAPNRPGLYVSFSIKEILERLYSFINVSPFSIIGIVFLFASLSRLKRFIRASSAHVLILLVSLEQLILPLYLGRFFVAFYSTISLILSIGIYNFVILSKYTKYVFYFAVFVLFSYYFVNSILVIPYGVGWAKKNAYLTRTLSRDNSSYYDYGNQFSSLILKNDVVAAYGLWGFYYALFDYIYAEDVFRKQENSLRALMKSKATKLLIKGGDITWLCIREKLLDCSATKYVFKSNYVFPHLPASQYLYELRR